ncbi:MAG: hypothetical protein EOL97_15080 [Spirochaetia bacterium]|nr:hypothetical protein [Spirochaetia bacterium]
MVKYCKECGKKMSSDALNCYDCGYRFQDMQNINVTLGSNKPKGSVGWLIFWIIMTGPFGLVYFLIRSWGK